MLLDSAIDVTIQASLVTDAHRRTIYSNAEFSRVTGYSADEMLGRNCSLLQGPDTDQSTIAELRRTLDAGLIYRGLLLNYRRDGSTFWNDLTISPVRDADGAIVNFVSVQRDATDRVEREHADRMPPAE
jgi:PAS domain S-box-containing protein